MHTAIPDIMHTLRESRLRALRVRGAGDAEMANDGYGSNKKAFCRTLGASGSVTLYVDDAAADGQLRSGATAGKCGDAPTTPPAAPTDDTTKPVISGIQVKDGTATGVVLKSGEEIGAKVVVSNANAKHTFLKLVDEAALPPEFVAEIRSFRTLSSAFKINLAVEEPPRRQSGVKVASVAELVDKLRREAKVI